MKETDEQVKAKLAVIMRVIDLDKAGKKDEAMALHKSMPLTPHIAKSMKDLFGAESVKTSGWNLSEAYAEYGQDWLER